MFRSQPLLTLFLISSAFLLPWLQAFGHQKDPCEEISEGRFPTLRDVAFADPLSYHNEGLALKEVKMLGNSSAEESRAAYLTLKRYVSIAEREGGVTLAVKKAIRYEATVRNGVASSNKVAYARLLLASMAPEKTASQKMLVDLLFFPTRDIAWEAFTSLASAEKTSTPILKYLRERCAYLDPSKGQEPAGVIGAGTGYGRLLLAFLDPRSAAAQVNVVSALSVADPRINYVALSANIIPLDTFFTSPLVAEQLSIRNRTIRVSALDVKAYVAEVMNQPEIEPNWFRDSWLLKRFN